METRLREEALRSKNREKQKLSEDDIARIRDRVRFNSFLRSITKIVIPSY